MPGPARRCRRWRTARPASCRRRAGLPPPKPSEFQKFVEAATGRLLPIFGAGFFADAADSFGRPTTCRSRPTTLVGPGDEIVLRAWGSIDVDYRSTVDRNGLLNLPKVGSFNVAGVKASELEKHLRAQIGRLYTNFNLSVALGQLRAVRVFVVGPAQRPGVYTLPSQSTLLSALVAAGGPAPQRLDAQGDCCGATARSSPSWTSTSSSCKATSRRTCSSPPATWSCSSRSARAWRCTGATRHPGHLRAEESRRSRCATCCAMPVARRCWRTRTACSSNASTRRSPRRRASSRSSGSTPPACNKPLRDGDVLTLLAISPQFANAVTLKGHVAQPLRYPYRPGMRIRDLIPDREALISPDFYRRKNLLVQVIEEEEPRRASTEDGAEAARRRQRHARPRKRRPSGQQHAAPRTREQRRRPRGGCSARAARRRRCSTS